MPDLMFEMSELGCLIAFIPKINVTEKNIIYTKVEESGG